MTEASSIETKRNMQPAAKLQNEENFRNNFRFDRQLPENLRFLETLSWNYFWSWKPEGTNLFREIDPRLWDECEQNPRLFLKRASELRLWQKALDTSYLKRLQIFSEDFEKYISAAPENFKNISGVYPAAYFCA